MSDKTLEEFKRFVEDCRKRELPDVIENASVTYATVLLKNLFIFAKEKRRPVQIVSGRLLCDAFDELIEDIKAVLALGLRVDVITMCPAANLANNTFYSVVHNDPYGRTASLNKDDEAEGHFCIVGNAYRMEVNNRAGTALASFNDKNGLAVPILRDRFKKLWEEATGGEADGRDNSNNVH